VNIEVVGFVCVGVLLSFALGKWGEHVAAQRLHRWAGEQNLVVVRSQQYASDYPRWHFRKLPGCFYVLVRDGSGAGKAGWVKTGSLLAEVLGLEVRVIWNSGAWGYRR
jgi:hypothetical protein